MSERLVDQPFGRMAEVARLINRRVCRIGHVSAPRDYVRHAYCSWQHRFDDPLHDYRTLYCAEQPITCLREVLGDLRPNTKARADFMEFQRAQGIHPDEVREPANEVTARWRQENALAPGVVRRTGRLADLGNRRLLEQLATAHAFVLAEHGMHQLDLTNITSKNRRVTQEISRDLYEHGAAGLLFRSNHDGARCRAVRRTRRDAASQTGHPDDPRSPGTAAGLRRVRAHPATSPDHPIAGRSRTGVASVARATADLGISIQGESTRRNRKALESSEALCRTRTGDPFLTIPDFGLKWRACAVMLVAK
ncbi:MAG: RES domain-containing protein [Solirubrobacteraceae bacterium]|nr:RES domain-containing protein [Solirubrobacteraceae bacterium]